MGTRLISKTWKVEGVLTDVTSAKLSDPTGTYGVKRNDTDATVVADGTAMTNSSTGTYEYSLTVVDNVSYTAYIEIVYLGATYHFEVDIPALTDDYGMIASYNSLLERVGHYLFGIRSGYSLDQTTDIMESVGDGLRDVYAAHRWSFFRPVKPITTTAPYSTGTVTVVDGVVTLASGTFPSWSAVGVLKVSNQYYDVDTRDSDSQVTLEDTTVDVDAGTSYELGRPEYDLPITFETIEGDLTYEPGQSDFYPPIRQRHDGEIRRMHQDDPYHDRPVYYGIRTKEFDPTVGSRRSLALYPTPDAAYVFKARMKLRSTMISVTNQYPVGAETLSQLITESCLAAAERNLDEMEGRHWKRVYGDPQAPEGSAARLGLLHLAIAADLDAVSPRSLGPDAPRVNSTDYPSRYLRMGDVSINGTTM